MKSYPRKLIASVSLCVAVALPNLASAVAVSGQGTWEGTLLARDLDGNTATIEAYYDTAQDITWLADANLAFSNTFGVGNITAAGSMLWGTAINWIQAMNAFNGSGYFGLNGWRLPVTVDVGNDGRTYSNLYQGVDHGYNITTHSELSHMYYVTLGNSALFDTNGVQTGCNTNPVDYCLTNSGPFSNLKSHVYWSGTEYLPDTTFAWAFVTSSGRQDQWMKISGTSYLFAWAVHDGDVGIAITTSTVPIPAAAWLLGSGLLGLVGVARHKRMA